MAEFIRDPVVSGPHFPATWFSIGGAINDNCVEVATNLPGVVAVRDSEDPSSPVLTFSPVAWRDFLKCVRDGDL
ncbi:DUF397 domain-containing protein [Streptosporangium sp. NPDC004631]